MFNSIYKDVKNQINFGNNITRLIIINVAVFIVLYVAFAFIALSVGPGYKDVQRSLVNIFAIPSVPIELLKKPWTIITHMFLHEEPFHLIFNMIWLYFFGRIFGDFMGDRRVVPLYLLGGLMGAAFFVIGTNLLLNSTVPALGASGAVLALVLGTVLISPDYELRLMFLGIVKLKWIGLFAIVVDLVGIANLSNTGGHFAHIGGMVMGWIFITLINNGNDPSPWFHKMHKGFLSIWDKSKQPAKKSPLKVRHKAKVTRKDRSKQGPSGQRSDGETKLDAILDKISKKGMKSLTAEEKDFLDNASKND
ncbi:rhomboid family intramembrane serine protease [Saprospiraceae bacterium]|nr:rhomboid family intramembrane serine protease [Saprospiraceae bacterium]